MTKLTSVFLVILMLSGCKNSNQKTQGFDHEIRHASSTDTSINKDPRDHFFFDNAVIPAKLIDFVKSMDATLRFPTPGDYDDYYFTGYADNKLPYFCSGYFNSDTLLDYGLVLIRDSTEQLIYSFHTDKDGFLTYLIKKRALIESENKEFKTLVFNIRTETERILEAIDTTYIIETDAIAVNDMYESRESMAVWNEKKDKYTMLVFD